MILTDVKVITTDGREVEFKHVAERNLKVIAPGMPIMLEFNSALQTPLGFAVLQPGMIVQYSNDAITSSQVADNGLVKISTDDTLPSDEIPDGDVN